MGNPLINIPDFDALAELVHAHKIPLISDNTFATSYLIHVFSHGVDIAVHSTTKFIGDHGTSIGVVIVEETSGKFPQFVDPDPIYHDISYSRDVGAATFATVFGLRSCAIQAQLCFHSIPLSSCKGWRLLQQTLERFKDVYQIQLATEQSDKNLAFYRELGFRRQEDFDCTGMIYAPNKK